MQNDLLFLTTDKRHAGKTLFADIALIEPTDPPLLSNAPFVPMECVTEWQRDIRQFEERGDRGGVRAAAGDVLMARITPCLENGKIAQIPTHVLRCGGSTEFVVFRAKKGTDRSYLYWLVSSDHIRNIAVAMMSGSTGRQRVSGKDLAGVLVADISTAEQARLGQLIDVVESNRMIFLKRCNAVRGLQRLLLNKVMGGAVS